MTLHFVYSQPTTPAGPGFSTDLGTSVVRLGSIQGLIAAAESGTVAISSIVLDDPGGTLDIVGLKHFRVTEDAAPNGSNVVWSGFIGRRTIRRGNTSQRPSLRVGTDREWDVELVDVNASLNFRVLSNGSNSDLSISTKRPAETDVARIDWLLSTVYLPLADGGLIDRSGPVNMDPADLTGRMADDVLRECAQASGKNYWAYYDRTHGSNSLGYLKASGTYGGYDSSMRLTNVLADVDQATTFYVLDDWQLVRDPTRVYAGVYLPYTGGAVYKYSYATSYAFGFRDGIWPAAHVTTAAGANTLATHALSISSTEDDRLTCRAKLPAAHVNDAIEGMRVQVNITALPDYTGYMWWRILRRTVAQDETSDDFYNVSYDMTSSPHVTGLHQVILTSQSNTYSALATMAQGSAVPSYFAGSGTSSPSRDPVWFDSDGYAQHVADAGASHGYVVRDVIIPPGLGGTYQVGFELWDAANGYDATTTAWVFNEQSTCLGSGIYPPNGSNWVYGKVYVNGAPTAIVGQDGGAGYETHVWANGTLTLTDGDLVQLWIDNEAVNLGGCYNYIGTCGFASPVAVFVLLRTGD